MNYIERTIPFFALVGIGLGIGFWWWWLIAPCGLLWIDCWMPRQRRPNP